MARRFVPTSADGWALAVWTLLVAGAVTFGEVWNVVDWVPGGGGFGPPSSDIAYLLGFGGFFIWLIGIPVLLALLNLLERFR